MYKKVYQIFLLLGIGLAVVLYGMFFDDFSETELVRLAYLWIPLISFGAAGLIAQEKQEKSIWVALTAATFITLGLMFFFEVMWSGL